MDHTQEQLKFIGFLGIFSQSLTTIIKFKKIFSQITITLILPLVITIIAHMSISHRFFKKIEQNPYQLIVGAYDSYRSYHDTDATPTDWLYYLLFESTTIAAVTVFSLLSTTTVVYTIASVYTGRDVTYRKSMKAVPKTWKKLTVTFICMYVTLLAYNLIVSVVTFLCYAIAGETIIYGFLLIAVIIQHFLGFLFILAVSQLASVVSVLETLYGIKAMVKAIDLINGKKKVAIAIWFLLHGFVAAVVCMNMALIVYDGGQLTTFWRLMIGILTGFLLLIAFLLIIVVETVVYLVCKSYHLETIDPVSISTYLGAYLSDSRPAFRVGEDIQLGRPQSQPVSQV